MLDRLLRVRYVYLVAVAFTLVNSVVFLLRGAVRSVKGYGEFLRSWRGEDVGRPGLELLESIDSFLVALVTLIFSLGIMKIFIYPDAPEDGLPGWLKIHDFKELKILLWETILVTLVAFSMSSIMGHPEAISWNSAVVPAIILLLAVSLALMRGKQHE